ncbi:MAG TPA: Mur ligase domain-containing protein, partial [Telluria sp.]|nr:Mur ligase domain-containing protein [Telluria sp.]
MANMTHQQVSEWIRQQAPQGELASDSRRVGPGDVFFAYPGETADGRNFIAAAIAAGAAAVVYDSQGFDWKP